MYTRKEFVDDILYSFTSDTLYDMFGVSTEEIENGAWNGNLEIAYQQVCPDYN